MSPDRKPDKVRYTTIADVPPIERNRNEFIRLRSEIPEYVEVPLVKACEIFYDKNVQTLSTSANRKDVEYDVGIILNYDSMSEENQAIAKEVGEILEYDRINALSLRYKIESTTTVEEIEKWSVGIAERFKKQPMTWCEFYTREYLEEAMMVTPGQTNKEVAEKWGYFYDEDNDVFFFNEEQAIKFKEYLIVEKLPQ